MIAEVPNVLLIYMDDRDGPWGPGNHDLSAVKLTFNHKLWFIHEIINNHCKTKNLVERFNLKERTIRDWCLKYKAGDIQYETRGRPKALDITALNSVHNYYTAKRPNEWVLKRKICYEHQQTIKRQMIVDITDEEDGLSFLSRRSINRYYQQIRGAGHTDNYVTM